MIRSSLRLPCGRTVQNRLVKGSKRSGKLTLRPYKRTLGILRLPCMKIWLSLEVAHQTKNTLACTGYGRKAGGESLSQVLNRVALSLFLSVLGVRCGI